MFKMNLANKWSDFSDYLSPVLFHILSAPNLKYINLENEKSKPIP